MATTIQSGRASSPLLTANIADHADVYGGRALVFDGVSDYLDCGKADLDTSDFTVSIWINFNNIGGYERIVGNRLSSGASQGFEIRTAGGSNGYEAVLDYGSAHFSASATYTSTNEWHHVCVTADRDGNMVLYINGLAESTVDISSGSSGSLNHSENLILGARPNFTSFFNGKMCDFKLFKGIAFSESQVQELYKKPESNPSNTTEYLERWYPMIEGGKPESPQSIVYDHSEKGLGSEKISANTTSEWGQYGSGGSESDIDNGVSLTAGSDTRNSYRTVSGLTDGKLYKLNVDAYYSGSSDTVKIEIIPGSGSLYTPNLTTTSTNYSIYFVKNSETMYILGNGFDNGNVLYIQNLSIKEILMGHHATTNFFGDELITNGTFEADSNWATAGATLNERSTEQVHSGSYSRKFTVNSQYDGIISDTFTTETGKTYSLSFEIYPDDTTSSAQFKIRRGDNSGEFTSLTGVMTQDAWNTITYTYTETHGGSGAYFNVNSNAITSGTYYIDDVSLKEVGISSSGFETAVNEPVVPQVPLMRYNQMSLMKRNVSPIPDVEIPSPYIILPANSAFTISFFFFPHESAECHILGGNNTLQDTIRLDTQGSNRIYFRINSSTIYFTGFSNIVANKPYFCTVTRDTSGNINAYINNIKSSVTGSSTDDFRISNIGGSNGYSTGVGAGLHNEISVFNTHFSDAEAQELFADSVIKDATTHSQSANLIGYWRNDGVTTWKDRSTNSNDGTVQGSPDSITIREGLNSNRDGLGFYFTNPSSNVLRLNGIDEHLKLPYTKSFDMGDGSFTVSAWVKTTLGVGDNQKTILWARDNDDSFKGFEFQIDDSADRPRFIISDGSGGECNGTNNSVESNKWHFVAVVVDRENDLAKIFLSESDGSALKCQTTTDISARGNINATPDWYVGKRNGATTQDFMGIIDELMVYNIALTALESDGTTVEAGDTVTSGELFKNYKFSKGKHKND